MLIDVDNEFVFTCDLHSITIKLKMFEKCVKTIFFFAIVVHTTQSERPSHKWLHKTFKKTQRKSQSIAHKCTQIKNNKTSALINQRKFEHENIYIVQSVMSALNLLDMLLYHIFCLYLYLVEAFFFLVSLLFYLSPRGMALSNCPFCQD